MKTKSLMIIIALFALVMGTTVAAYAVTITPIASSDVAGVKLITKIAPGERFFVLVQVDDATNIAGAALTLNYNKDLFEAIRNVPNQTVGTPLSSEVSPTTDYSQNLAPGDALDSDTFTAATDGTAGITSTIIRLANVDVNNGKIILSGASIDPDKTNGGDGPYTGKKNLFKVRFRAKTGSTGIGQFSLSLTTPTTGGWNGTDTVWPLVGAAAKGTNAFSNLTSPTTNNSVSDCGTYAFCNLAYSLGSPVSVEVSGIAGDLNGDGKKDVYDVRHLLYYLYNKGGVYSTALGNLDFNHDGKFDVYDVRYMLYNVYNKTGYTTLE